MRESAQEIWDTASPYERYVGRWSRSIARDFLAWLALPSGLTWADVGCGTGALVANILSQAEPASVLASDRSERFLAVAPRAVSDDELL